MDRKGLLNEIEFLMHEYHHTWYMDEQQKAMYRNSTQKIATWKQCRSGLSYFCILGSIHSFQQK